MPALPASIAGSIPTFDAFCDLYGFQIELPSTISTNLFERLAKKSDLTYIEGLCLKHYVKHYNGMVSTPGDCKGIRRVSSPYLCHASTESEIAFALTMSE